jgi:dephospho-CoA kinase
LLRIGLTGGIGSGKSTVAQVFETLGIPVYYADAAAKKLMHENRALKAEITKHFGEQVYKNGELDRPYLASLAFASPEKTRLLNSLVHPYTITEAEAWMNDPFGTGQLPPYAIKEAALIFESGSDKKLDYVIGVCAPDELRLKRAMLRDKISEEEVRKRMLRQMEEEEKMKRCDFIITNDEKQMVIPQVLKIHTRLTSLNL